MPTDRVYLPEALVRARSYRVRMHPRHVFCGLDGNGWHDLALEDEQHGQSPDLAIHIADILYTMDAERTHPHATDSRDAVARMPAAVSS